MEDNILEIDFMKVRELREKNISRTEALDQIKPVEYLPECKLLTAKMAAKYYVVSERRIQELIQEHKIEFEESEDIIVLYASDFNVTRNYRVTKGNLKNGSDEKASHILPNYDIKQAGPNAKAYYDGVFLFNIGGTGINLINNRGLLRCC